MRILQVTPSFYPATYWGGPIFSIYALCNGLARIEDVDLRVVTTDAAGPARSQRLDTAALSPTLYPGYAVRFARRVMGHSIAPGMIPLLWREAGRAELVHISGTYSPPTLLAFAAARLRGKPVVWSPRGALQASHEWKGVSRGRVKRVWEQIIRALAPQDMVIHTTAPVEKDATEARMPGFGTVVIPNGVAVAEAAADRTWRPDGQLRLMFISRLHVKKGLEILLDALAGLPPHVTLDIYGTGEPDYVAALEARVKQLGLAGRIRFGGHVDGEAKQAAFADADLFVLPSFSENFGIVVAEALAAGVPVIPSRNTPWQGVEEHGCGLWVENTAPALVDAITAIEGADLAQMGRRGRDWMARDFGWERIACDMYDSYRMALAGRRPGVAQKGARGR
jgi:glycosyltransferase involved in cell wall biosynthesis